MASLKFKVTRKPAVLVAPSLPTPREILYLSNIDDQASLRFHSTGFQFYRFDPSRKGEDPARVICEGLEKVLVWYYPYTGRLIDAPDGKLVVECTGEGVLFVEADADVALEEFGDLYPPFPCRDDLLNVPGSVTTNSPVLHIQVTRLRCGGFILATALNHTMSDAIGYVQFMQALSEMVKGAARPSVLPKNLFFFGQKEIELLKRQAVEQGKCSTFDVLSALLWRLRTRSLQLPAEQGVRFIFPVDARAKFEPPLPEGFYGNAVCLACTKTTAGDLAKKPLSFAVKLIQEAKKSVNDEYMRSVIDLMELKGRPLFTVVGSYLISDCTKIGFQDVNSGWGTPAYGGPAEGGVGAVLGLSSFLIPYQTRQGVKGIVVPVCLPSGAMKIFQVEIKEAIENAPLVHRNCPN
eukprot:PITA_17036